MLMARWLLNSGSKRGLWSREGKESKVDSLVGVSPLQHAFLCSRHDVFSGISAQCIAVNSVGLIDLISSGPKQYSRLSKTQRMELEWGHCYNELLTIRLSRPLGTQCWRPLITSSLDLLDGNQFRSSNKGHILHRKPRFVMWSGAVWRH